MLSWVGGYGGRGVLGVGDGIGICVKGYGVRRAGHGVRTRCELGQGLWCEGRGAAMRVRGPHW